MRPPVVRGIAVATAVPFVLALAGCGSNDGSQAAQDPAAPSSSQSGSAQVSSAPQAGAPVDKAQFLRMVQAGVAKITTVKVAMTGDLSGGGYTMKGAMDLTGDKPAMQMTMNLSSSGVSNAEMRLVDGTMYMSLGSMTGGKFVKFDLSDPNSPLGPMSSTLSNLDPSQLMGQLRPEMLRHLVFVGSDQHGRHYRATLVTAKAPQLQGVPSSALGNLPKTMSYDVWLDDQGRFSRFVVSVPKFMKMTGTYTDYGAPVHITAPPASQVTAMPGTSSTS